MSYSIACHLVKETDNALLIRDPMSDESHWIPFSQIEEIHRDPGGKTGTVVMSEWIARQKGLP